MLDLASTPVTTWTTGKPADVAWSMIANHGGGYSCERPLSVLSCSRRSCPSHGGDTMSPALPWPASGLHLIYFLQRFSFIVAVAASKGWMGCYWHMLTPQTHNSATPLQVPTVPGKYAPH